jgi:hypothetical protein
MMGWVASLADAVQVAIASLKLCVGGHQLGLRSGRSLKQNFVLPVGGAESRVWRRTDRNIESKFVVAG